jgi:hypothetical protein
MLPVKQAFQELSNAAAYERLLNDAYKKVSLKETVPVKQQEAFDFEEQLNLQQNLTKNNLKQLFPNQEGLINQIIQYIIETDGDLVEFNKYFPTFKLAVAGIRIKSFEDFQNIWNQFKSQRLGAELAITPEIKISSNILSLNDLETMPSKDLDDLFRQSLIKTEKKSLDLIKSFRYITFTNQLSKETPLKEKEGLLWFDPPDVKETKGFSEKVKVNTAKVRYIYKTMNPQVSMRIAIQWKGPVRTKEFASQAGSTTKETEVQTVPNLTKEFASQAGSTTKETEVQTVPEIRSRRSRSLSGSGLNILAKKKIIK